MHLPLLGKEIIMQSDVMPKGVGEVLVAFIRPMEEHNRAHWIVSEKSGDALRRPVRFVVTWSLKDSHHRSPVGFIFHVDRTRPILGKLFPDCSTSKVVAGLTKCFQYSLVIVQLPVLNVVLIDALNPLKVVVRFPINTTCHDVRRERVCLFLRYSANERVFPPVIDIGNSLIRRKSTPPFRWLPSINVIHPCLFPFFSVI
mmetsp:Transcript_25767/g.74545  ORF Transcript_25767/g.74545 Transcript_25767/m.74545 type:complete len:200 (+) Transcript_25767:223-822(+)